MVGTQLKLNLFFVSLYFLLSVCRWMPHILPLPLFLALDLHFALKKYPHRYLWGISNLKCPCLHTNFSFLNVLQPSFCIWFMVGLSKAVLLMWLVQERMNVSSLSMWNPVSSHLVYNWCTLTFTCPSSWQPIITKSFLHFSRTPKYFLLFLSHSHWPCLVYCNSFFSCTLDL